MKFIVEAMRNPTNSWENSDSIIGCYPCGDRNKEPDRCDCCSVAQWEGCNTDPEYCLGKNDHSLMQRLAKEGTDHRKFMRMMPVYVRITAPLYWWKEFDIDTYKVGSVVESCSTMYKIQEKEFTLEDFSTEHMRTGAIKCLNGIIDELNKNRNKFINFDNLGYDNDIYDPERKAEIKKDIWLQMIQLLPSSYNQTRNIMMNYEVLSNIYKSRKDINELYEWCEFCMWIKSLPYSDLICSC